MKWTILIDFWIWMFIYETIFFEISEKILENIFVLLLFIYKRILFIIGCRMEITFSRGHLWLNGCHQLTSIGLNATWTQHRLCCLLTCLLTCFLNCSQKGDIFEWCDTTVRTNLHTVSSLLRIKASFIPRIDSTVFRIEWLCRSVYTLSQHCRTAAQINSSVPIFNAQIDRLCAHWAKSAFHAAASHHSLGTVNPIDRMCCVFRLHKRCQPLRHILSVRAHSREFEINFLRYAYFAFVQIFFNISSKWECRNSSNTWTKGIQVCAKRFRRIRWVLSSVSKAYHSIVSHIWHHFHFAINHSEISVCFSCRGTITFTSIWIFCCTKLWTIRIFCHWKRPTMIFWPSRAFLNEFYGTLKLFIALFHRKCCFWLLMVSRHVLNGPHNANEGMSHSRTHFPIFKWKTSTFSRE